MTRRGEPLARLAFATGMIGLGIVGLVYGDFAQTWRAVPVSVPVRHALGYASAAVMLGCGLALLSKRASVAAARVLVAYWTLLVLLREVPVVVAHPLVEVAWQGVAHFVVLLAAACGVLFGVHARLAAAFEAAMLAAFTFLVWIPRIVAAPTTQGLWSEFTISWAICVGAWVVAANIPESGP